MRKVFFKINLKEIRVSQPAYPKTHFFCNPSFGAGSSVGWKSSEKKIPRPSVFRQSAGCRIFSWGPGVQVFLWLKGRKRQPSLEGEETMGCKFGEFERGHLPITKSQIPNSKLQTPNKF
jgi:hypothetical protein